MVVSNDINKHKHLNSVHNMVLPLCHSFLEYILEYLSFVMRKLAFASAKTKAQISCAVTAQLIRAFVFNA